MPRGPRLDYPGTLHHVIVRGIERRNLFHSGDDHRDFLDRLADLVLLGKIGRGREKWACDGCILGSSDFAREVLSRLQPDLPPRPPTDPAAMLAALATQLASKHAVSASEIASPSPRRGAVDARALLSCAAVRLYGLTLTTVARHLAVSVTSIARGLARGQQLIDSGVCSLEDLRLG